MSQMLSSVASESPRRRSRGAATGKKADAMRLAVSKGIGSSSSSSSAVDDLSPATSDAADPITGLEDVAVVVDEAADDIELAVQKLDKLLASWEKSSFEFMEKKSDAAYQFVSHLRDDFVAGSKAKYDALLKYTEDNLHKGSGPSATFAAGLRHLETMIRSAEESHAAHLVEQALQSAKDRLLYLEELPRQWIDNPYILSGYRFSRNARECFASVFAVHNETCNIWTHLLGAVFMVALGLFHLPRSEIWQNGSWSDRIPMIVFVGAAIECLLCSVTWHTFCNISRLTVKKRVACVDYVGITVLITASILTTEYSVLYCRPLAQAFYMFMTFVSGIFGTIVAANPKFDTPAARPVRALFFCCFALAGAFAGIHAMCVRGVWEVLPYYLPVIKSVGCYAIGVVFYALLIPERWTPGSITDLVGMSHNIWHLCVLAGIYYHYQAMMTIFEKAQTAVC